MSSSLPPLTAGLTKFVARQAILDRAQKIMGYELLFRSGIENSFPDTHPGSAASRAVLDKALLVGIDVLCDGGKAFVNCTQEVLTDYLITVLPPSTTVVEILEGVEVSDSVFAACRTLKGAGYMLALDDFVPGGPQQQLLPLVDIVKIDVQETPPGKYRSFLREQLARGVWAVAEKVETQECYEEARSVGFTHFQGYYFAKPVVLDMPDLPTDILSRLRLLQCIASEELNYREVETTIKCDPALVYRLLRYLNSALFSFPCSVSSVRHALSLLGDQEIRRWMTLIVAIAAVQDKPMALLRLALLRAKFCGAMGRILHWRGSDLFLLGLFSLMDTILGVPMPELLRRVRLPDPISQALLGQSTSLDPVMRLIYGLESADWKGCDEVAQQLGLRESVISQAYIESVAWTKEFVKLT
jgi:EAL and modified HD-GYP domain-containing signal transduction protein